MARRIMATLRFSPLLLGLIAIVPLDASAQGQPGDVGVLTSDSASLDAGKFVNPIGEGADPWVVRDEQNNRYLWCMSQGNRAIAIHTSDQLTSMGKKHIVWRAPSSGPYSQEVWAPELHFIKGRWYVYFAASDGANENHLAYVLESKTDDPLGEYELHGPLATGDGVDGRSPNVWAIDMTVLPHNGNLYAIWSGWDAPGTDRQFLYIAPMKSPTELSGTRVRLCNNSDYLWERTEPKASERGLNEGPQVFQAGGKSCVVYSCGASWLPTYKLGMLELVGSDPLDPSAWRKRSKAVFEGTEEVYGVGHSCFVKSPDGTQWWHVYHAKRDRRPGWRREIRVQPMKVDAEGYPVFGRPLTNERALDRPSGETTASANLPVRLFGKPQNDAGYSYFGHHQFIDVSDRGLELGRVPADPVNGYRCGEKVVCDLSMPDDIQAEVTIDFRGSPDARDAGILFRCTGASVGYDAQKAYFAGLIPKTGIVVLGKTNGENWTELSRSPTTIDVAKPQTLTVQAIGDRITVNHNQTPRIAISDSNYTSGKVGLRVVDTHACFTDLTITDPE